MQIKARMGEEHAGVASTSIDQIRSSTAQLSEVVSHFPRCRRENALKLARSRGLRPSPARRMGVRLQAMPLIPRRPRWTTGSRFADCP